MHCESISLAAKIQVQMAKPSPWLALIAPEEIPEANAQYSKHIDEVYAHAKRHPTKWPAGMGNVVRSLMFERAVA